MRGRPPDQTPPRGRASKPGSWPKGHQVPMLVHASPRLSPLLEADRFVPVLCDRLTDPPRRRLVALPLGVQASLDGVHEAHLASRLFRHQRPDGVLDEGREPWHVDDDQLVQALGKVTLLRLGHLARGRGVKVQVGLHAVHVPDVHGLLHTRRQVVNGLEQRDQRVVEALGAREELVLHAHVQDGAPLLVGANNAVVPRNLGPAGRQ
mmetsp:Transcript_123047/g.355587  ORF Transcript_123047/g.355587 Transcript_123047/m.355587 type:complete len:207 (-) Transcript_123047:816-1436(-)